MTKQSAMTQYSAIVSLVAGGFLMIAALLKISSGTAPIAFRGWTYAAQLGVALVAFESLLASCLFLFWHVRSIRVLAGVTFAIFSCVNIGLLMEGQSSCGCFGNVSVSPIAALVLDLALAVALSLTWSQSIERAPLPFREFSLCSLFGSLSVLMFVGWGGIQRLENKPIRFDSSILEIGTGVTGHIAEKSLSVRNTSDHEIRIVAYSPRCSLHIDGELPVVIPANSSRCIPVLVPFRGDPGIFRRRIEFYLDSPEQTRLMFDVAGRVILDHP